MGAPPPMVLPEYPLERPSRREPSRACTASSVTPESSRLLRATQPQPPRYRSKCTSHPLKAACRAAQASVCPAPAMPCSQSRQDCLLKQAWEPRLCRVPLVWPLASFPPFCASVSLCVTCSVCTCFRNCWEGRSGIAGGTEPREPSGTGGGSRPPILPGIWSLSRVSVWPGSAVQEKSTRAPCTNAHFLVATHKRQKRVELM